ncbi:ATP-dependent DNA helicase [Colwellia psychrerythraea]|uniref:UvrD-like helicase C-terminal domain-containing protein n=1 Tax=Colwellia psychrerythraea (strain 34H / ATCC BAA-681) TaxID=167879 RepID=Q47ZW4_COLP3|nr:AAA family ATPase [Colwellia psychrerythraea]AAZ25363.1 hypothetical protein CPS_2955 [Colwellia psychrerythraea 34H]
MNILDCFSGKQLTQGQHDLVEELDQFLFDDTRSVFLLKGWAGVGKTFITAGITKYLNTEGRQFVLMAPTGKAAKVIANKTKQKALTIHRVIYSYFDVNNSNENKDKLEPPIVASKIKENKDAPDTVYIIDESSMISDKFNKSEACSYGSGYLLIDLLEYINLDKRHKKKVIFIGDNAQLPPVRDNFSPALDNQYLRDKYQLNCQAFELKEVVRQKAGSGVIAIAKQLRHTIGSNTFSELSFDVSAGDTHVLTINEMLEEYFRVCEERVEKTKEVIIIAYSNIQVRNYNNTIRAKLFSPDAPLQIGEKIMCVSNFIHDDSFISNGEFGKVINISSNIEIRTAEVYTERHGRRVLKYVDLVFLDVEIEFLDDHGKPFILASKILSNLLYGAMPRLSQLEYKALYADFFQRNPNINYNTSPAECKELMNKDPYLNIIQIKFGYSITCHKAQGSEWAHVFVDRYHRLPKSNECLRWLYTAVTRTSKNLYVSK